MDVLHAHLERIVYFLLHDVQQETVPMLHALLYIHAWIQQDVLTAHSGTYCFQVCRDAGSQINQLKIRQQIFSRIMA